MARRHLALLAAVPVLAVLAGCSPFDQFIDSANTPVPLPTTSVTSTPSATVTPSPVPVPGSCTITSPGSYTVQDCTVLSVQGQNIAATARTIGTLDVQGDGLKVAVAAAGSVKIGGQDNV